jgi:uncharacterized damage-inducible protein DinB
MAAGTGPACQESRMQMTPKQQFLDGYNREYATTVKVLKAYPDGHAELRPAAKCKTARELAWVFVLEQGMCMKALTTGFDWSKPSPMPPAPARMADVVAAFEQGREQLASLVARADDNLTGTVKFPVAAKTIADVPLGQFLWMTLCDQIHHRGQFSVYLRIAGAKVPSIYGPTADETWT